MVEFLAQLKNNHDDDGEMSSDESVTASASSDQVNISIEYGTAERTCE